MYFIDGFYEVFFLAILLPEIPFNPLVRTWYCLVYLSQSLVEDIAEMPQSIVNINDCLFHVLLFILVYRPTSPKECPMFFVNKPLRDYVCIRYWQSPYWDIWDVPLSFPNLITFIEYIKFSPNTFVRTLDILIVHLHSNRSRKPVKSCYPQAMHWYLVIQ